MEWMERNHMIQQQQQIEMEQDSVSYHTFTAVPSNGAIVVSQPLGVPNLGGATTMQLIPINSEQQFDIHGSGNAVVIQEPLNFRQSNLQQPQLQTVISIPGSTNQGDNQYTAQETDRVRTEQQQQPGAAGVSPLQLTTEMNSDDEPSNLEEAPPVAEDEDDEEVIVSSRGRRTRRRRVFGTVRTQRKRKTKANKSESLTKPREVRGGSRGHYATYGPELRGQIAAYAVSHTNKETVEFFADHHGIELPESTVRGLRRK